MRYMFQVGFSESRRNKLFDGVDVVFVRVSVIRSTLVVDVTAGKCSLVFGKISFLVMKCKCTGCNTAITT